MTDLNHQIKKIKAIDLSEELLKKHISLKQVLCRKREFILNLNPEELILQRIKRTKAHTWKFDSQDGYQLDIKSQKTASYLLIQVLRFDKAIQKLFVSFFTNGRQKDFLLSLPSLKRAKSLQKMTFKIDGRDQISDTEIRCLTKNLPSLLSLKDISLVFASTKDITDIGLYDMSRALKKLPFLKKIFVELEYFTSISNKRLSKLNGSLNRLTKLEDIYLRIRYCHMNDLAVEKMNFKRLTSLQKIILSFPDFPETKLTDKGIFLMTKSLKGLPNLHTVKLEFWDCIEFSDSALFSIWEMLNSLPSLRVITLVFSQCDEMTDAGFDDMNRTLDFLGSVQKIYFEFFHCPKISDDGLFSLCQALAKGVSLESLSISFAECEKITDLGVEKVVDCMNELAHLRGAGLDFECCERLTDASLKKISQLMVKNK